MEGAELSYAAGLLHTDITVENWQHLLSLPVIIPDKPAVPHLTSYPKEMLPVFKTMSDLAKLLNISQKKLQECLQVLLPAIHKNWEVREVLDE